MRGEVLRFPGGLEPLTPSQGRESAERALSVPIPDRDRQTKDLRVEHPEVLLAICEILTARIESDPAGVAEEAEYLYRHLERPIRKIGEFDEREYFLGELALLAGGAARILFRRDEARRWLDRAESNFVRVANASIHFARLAYQRLALATEEHRFDEVVELAPVWHQNCVRLGLAEDAVKCRFLEGLARWESGDPEAAIATFAGILGESEALGLPRLAAQAANNLAHFHSARGEIDAALDFSRRALPYLQETNSRVHLAKLRWSIADLLRAQGKRGEAVDTYRQSLRDCEEIGLRGDAAAIHLVLADVLLDVGQEAQAEWEVRAALPVIEEENMIPEGLAAFSLLRESLRRRKIDREALRRLHGFFRQ